MPKKKDNNINVEKKSKMPKKKDNNINVEKKSKMPKKEGGMFGFSRKNKKDQIDDRSAIYTIPETFDQTKIDNVSTNSEIIGSNGSSYLKIKLDIGEKIFATKGVMIYMHGNISKPEVKHDGFIQAAKRRFAGEKVFYQLYTGIDENKGTVGTVAFGIDIPNDIIQMKISFGTKMILSKNSILAYTENIIISMDLRVRGIIGVGSGEGVALPTAECIKGTEGYIWVSTYGTFEQINIEPNDFILIDNGTFLGCNSNIHYTLEKVNRTYFGTLFGGEGFAMKFTGPCKIYIQSKSFNNLIKILQSHIRVNTGNSRNGNGSIGSSVKMLGDIATMATDLGEA